MRKYLTLIIILIVVIVIGILVFSTITQAPTHDDVSTVDRTQNQ